jgi:hypothetical protein
MELRSAVTFVLAATLAGAVPVAGQGKADIPSPDLLVSRAWDEAGGIEIFRRLGIVYADFSSEEITQGGKPKTSISRAWFVAPGPNPGRIEIENPRVISGDDGQKGWAIVGGKPDVRQSTEIMVKRLLVTKLFTLMLPFSLGWDGVILRSVEPAVVKDVPVWRLTIDVTKTFFHSPQIATTWRVDFRRDTYAVVQAESPATDMGKGIKADGMRVSWSRHQSLNGVRLPGEQRILGLSETGSEKAHTRIDQVRYNITASEAFAKLFTNPVPPELRPTPQPLEPPQRQPRPTT